MQLDSFPADLASFHRRTDGEHGYAGQVSASLHDEMYAALTTDPTKRVRTPAWNVGGVCSGKTPAAEAVFDCMLHPDHAVEAIRIIAELAANGGTRAQAWLQSVAAEHADTHWSMVDE